MKEGGFQARLRLQSPLSSTPLGPDSRALSLSRKTPLTSNSVGKPSTADMDDYTDKDLVEIVAEITKEDKIQHIGNYPSKT